MLTKKQGLTKKALKTRFSLKDIIFLFQMAKPSRSNNSNTEQQSLRTKYKWVNRLINQPSFRVTLVVVVCTLNIVDLFVDWYFFMSKATIRKVIKTFYNRAKQQN